MKNFVFFSDFDGTITKEDTLNKFLQLYAYPEWIDVENKWLNGEIGSKECIEKQMQMFPQINDKIINDFVNSIEIDETFPDFLNYLKSENIDFYIVSDGFDLLIEKILKKYNLKDIKIFSNKLKLVNGKFETEFPNYNPNCKRQSGVCKCNVLNKNKIVTKRVLYAGDGLSDFCVSSKVDILFAKGSLLEYCKNTKNKDFNINPIGFDAFSEIKNYIKSV